MSKIDIELASGQKAGETLKQLTNQAAAFKKELSGLKPETEEFIKAAKSLNQVEKKLADVKEQVKQTTSASDAMKKAWNQLPGAQFFNQISSSFTTFKAGVGGLVSQFGVLKTAIAATGLGLLVIVLGGLFNWLSKIESVTNVVKGAWNGLTAAANQLFNAIATLDFTGLGDKMAKAAKEGYDLVQAFDALEDAQLSLDLSNAQAGKSLDQILLRSKNVQLSYKERIELLNQADIIEEFQSKRRLKYAQDYEALVLREAENVKRLGQNEDDIKKKIIAAKIAVIDAEREDIALREKIANRRSALEEKQIADNEKRAAAAQKERDKKLKAEQDALKESLAAEDNLRKLANEKELLDIADQQKREIEKLNQDTDAKIIALQGSDLQIFEQTKLLREIQGQELAAINEKYRLQEIEANRKKYDEFLKQQQENADKQKKLAEEQNRFTQAIQDARFGLESTALAATVQLLSEDEKARKKNAAAIKAFTIGQIIVDTQREIAGYYANPASTATLGTAGTLKTIAALIRAGVAVAKVNATQFKDGGIPSGVLFGPSHAQGGIPLVAEGHEIIMTKGVFQNAALRSMASAINVAGGGRRFAAGGPTNPFDNSRGPVSSGKAGSPGTQDLLGFSELKNAFIAYAEEVKTWQRDLKVHQNLSETRKGLSTLQSLDDDANV